MSGTQKPYVRLDLTAIADGSPTPEAGNVGLGVGMSLTLHRLDTPTNRRWTGSERPIALGCGYPDRTEDDCAAPAIGTRPSAGAHDSP